METQHGKLSGFHVFIPRLFHNLNFCGSISHIFGPIYDILSVPWYTVMIIGLENSETCYKLYGFFVFNFQISGQ